MSAVREISANSRPLDRCSARWSTHEVHLLLVPSEEVQNIGAGHHRARTVVSQLVVVTGPIASGKSSVTRMLTERLCEAGRSVAVVDLDDIVAMLHAPLENVEQTWASARELHGRLVGEWLSAGVDVVIADGPFYTQNETTALMERVPTGIVARRVMLLCADEAALERVAGEPSRGASKDPVILRKLHKNFTRELPGIAPCEWTFDTANGSVDHVVTTVARVLLVN